jgi:hypothetical protein
VLPALLAKSTPQVTPPASPHFSTPNYCTPTHTSTLAVHPPLLCSSKSLLNPPSHCHSPKVLTKQAAAYLSNSCHHHRTKRCTPIPHNKAFTTRGHTRSRSRLAGSVQTHQFCSVIARARPRRQHRHCRQSCEDCPPDEGTGAGQTSRCSQHVCMVHCTHCQLLEQGLHTIPVNVRVGVYKCVCMRRKGKLDALFTKGADKAVHGYFIESAQTLHAIEKSLHACTRAIQQVAHAQEFTHTPLLCTTTTCPHYSCAKMHAYTFKRTPSLCVCTLPCPLY